MHITEYSHGFAAEWMDPLEKATGFTLRVFHKERYIAGQAGESPLCRLLQEFPEGRTFCVQDCTPPLLEALERKDVVYFKCYAHLNSVAFPLYHKEALEKQSLILGGRIVASYDDLVGYRAVAEKIGCAEDRILDVVRGVSIREIGGFKTSMEGARGCLVQIADSREKHKTMMDRVAKINTIIRVASDLGGSSNSGEFHSTILNTLGVLFNVKTAMLLTRDVSRGRFIAREVFGEGKGVLSGYKVGEDKGLIGEAAIRKQPVSSTDLFDMLKLGLPNGLISIRIFPIVVENSAEGLIVILNTSIPPEDEELIQSFCRSIALSFENRRLLSRQEIFAKKGIALLDALYSIAEYIDSPDLFNVIIRNTAGIVEAEQGSIMLLDEDKGSIEVKATKGLNAAILNHIRINPGEGIAGIVLERGAPMIVGNIEEDERVSRPNRVRYKTKSFISIPLKIRNKCIGVINLSDKANGEEFSDRDLRLLETMALYSTVAIERRIYYESSVNLRKISITDSLTGLLNRRYFEERISEEMERSKRHGQPFSLIILDIDNFKDFNDTYGHPSGDEALKSTGQVIRRCIRIIDIAARYGGEEFAVILPTTGREEARLIGERIREELDRMSFIIKGGATRGDLKAGYLKPASLTVSLGIASYPTDASSIEELVNNADRALYKAKDLGKNRVVLFGNI